MSEILLDYADKQRLAKDADRFEELRELILNAYAVKSAGGSVVNIADGANNVPVKSLIIGIVANQIGSGDPSPDNVRPISGWTGANVTRTGKNLFQLGLVPSAKSGVTVTDIPDGYRLTATAAVGYIWARFRLLDAAKFAGKTLTVKGKALVSASQSTQISLHYRDASDAPIQLINGAATNGYATATLTLPSDATGNVSVALYCTTSPAASIGDTAEWTELQLEIGSSATAYEPYQGDTYYIAFPAAAGTVYGGTLDASNGKLMITHGQISNYAGETLPGEWVSDRDVYTPGATPTTGAQVVYVLDTPVIYDISQAQVRTLLGTNNFWADCGNTTVEYRVDPSINNSYINSDRNSETKTDNTQTAENKVVEMNVKNDNDEEYQLEAKEDDVNE